MLSGSGSAAAAVVVVVVVFFLFAFSWYWSFWQTFAICLASSATVIQTYNAYVYAYVGYRIYRNEDAKN